VFGADCHFAVQLSRARGKPSPVAFRASNAQVLTRLCRTWVDRTQYDRRENLGVSLTASNTFPFRRAYKDMRVQITACLVCLMIVGGSLDRIPDPPAVQPHGNQNKLVSRLDYDVAVAANPVSDCAAAALHFQDSFFSFRQIFEGTGSSHKLDFVRQATDTSPPYFS
jgi:hypothetical protein